MRWVIRALLATGAALGPGAAAACPACATRGAAGAGTWALIAAMVAVPYAVSVVAIRVIRRLEKDAGG